MVMTTHEESHKVSLRLRGAESTAALLIMHPESSVQLRWLLHLRREPEIVRTTARPELLLLLVGGNHLMAKLGRNKHIEGNSLRNTMLVLPYPWMRWRLLLLEMTRVLVIRLQQPTNVDVIVRGTAANVANATAELVLLQIQHLSNLKIALVLDREIETS